ncbi:MAG: rRNA pseudouridine synthase [Clostridia bacterium]|nr:rRNA pseudouridine synthase [Clostridia bacterium]
MRLQKYLALCGVASRRAAEAMMAEGRVLVNGHLAQTPGIKVNPETDQVTVDGKPVSPLQKKIYIMLNKPVGYVSTAKDNFDRPTVLDLVPDTFGRLYPVGRLDYDSEGLLLLTNDGDLTYRLTHPGHEVSKTYAAVVAGAPSGEALNALRNGVLIDGQMTHPAQVTVKTKSGKNTCLHITIHEGRNRQVRKMCAAIGHAVITLSRIAEGGLALGDLPLGSWRLLTEDEIKKLKG